MTPTQQFILEVLKTVAPVGTALIAIWNLYITNRVRGKANDLLNASANAKQERDVLTYKVDEVSGKQDETNSKLNGHMERLVSAIEEKLPTTDPEKSKEP